MALKKITYENKINSKEVVDRTKQSTAEDWNQVKEVVNPAIEKIEEVEASVQIIQSASSIHIVDSETEMTAKWNELNTLGAPPKDGTTFIRTDSEFVWKWDSSVTAKGVVTIEPKIKKADAIEFGNTGVAISGDVAKSIKNKPNLEKLSKNIFHEETDIVFNSGIGNDGIIYDNSTYANWGRSILFPCVQGEKIHLGGVFGRERFVFYSDKLGQNVVENNSDNHGVKTVPSGALFYAFNIQQASNQNYSNIMLNKGDNALPYEPSIFKIPKDKIEQYAELAGDNESLENSEKYFKGKKIEERINEVGDTKTPLTFFEKITEEISIISNNIFDKDNHIVTPRNIQNDGSITTANTGWGMSILYPCVESDIIHLGGVFGRKGFAFYSNNNPDGSGYIAGSFSTNYTTPKIAPAGALFYAFNIFSSSATNYSNVMLNKGNDPLPYESFVNETKLIIKDDALPAVTSGGLGSLQLQGEDEQVLIKGTKYTREIEALRVSNPLTSRVLNFNTDKINNGNVTVRQWTRDDVAPIRCYGTTLLANHAYFGFRIDSQNHGKTDADVGSIFSYGGNTFVLTNIVNEGQLWAIAETEGNSNVLDENVTLEYTSGGVSVANILVENYSFRQHYPCSSNHNIDIYVDDKKLEVFQGVFNYNQKVVFKETYNLLPKTEIINWFKNNYDGSLNPVGEVAIYNSIDYIFDVEGNCTISGDYNFAKSIIVADIMALQAIEEPILDKFYIPKTIEFTHQNQQLNFSMIEDAQTATNLGGSSINITPDRLDDSATPSNRWLQLASDGSKGFAMGYLPVGSASEQNRGNLTTTNTLEIRGNTNKMYPRLVDISDFNSTIGQSFSYVGYRNIFKPENGATANYPVRSNVGDFYFVDYHNTKAIKQFEMPNDFIGKEIEIVEQRNIKCNQLITSNKLTISVECINDYGYLVIKIKK